MPPAPFANTPLFRAPRAVVWVILAVFLLVFAWSLSFYARLTTWTPKPSDWRAAAARVAEYSQPDDMVAIVPFWATTGERAFVEARLTYRYVRWVAREDWAGHPRLWVVHAYDRFKDRDVLVRAGFVPEFHETQGALTIERFAVPDGDVATYRFYDHLAGAEVEQVIRRRARPCLGWNPDGERFECTPGSTWNYVGRLTREVGFGIRPTIWAHPIQNGAIRVRFKDVPLTRRIVVHTGLTHYAVANRKGTPVIVDVLVDGAKIGEAIQPNERGWFRHEFLLPAPRERPSRVEFEIRTKNQGRRHFTFDAYAQ